VKRLALTAAALMALAATDPGAPPPTPGASPRFPGFAAALAQMPAIDRPFGWAVIEDGKAWRALARSTPPTRQAARWAYAKSLIGSDRAAEAYGVLQVMLADDPDLALTSSFTLATGVAAASLDRPSEALGALANDELAANPEACAWRLRALEALGEHGRAAREVDCALPAINARDASARLPFVLAAANAAVALGYPRQALTWLNAVDDRDAAANLARGRALLAAHEPRLAGLRFDRARVSGTAELQAEADVGHIEAALAQQQIKPDAAVKKLDQVRFGWRGGAVERRALAVSFGLIDGANDPAGKLRTGATMLRYFDMGKATAGILATLQETLVTALAPTSKLALPQLAGLYWDYREFAPPGAAGDALTRGLAERLSAAGLYARAADLLRYQLTQRAEDVTKGPLSIEVATLQILAGAPDDALQAIHDSEGPDYPPDIRSARKRIEAVALARSGKPAAAIAALQDVPDTDALRAEILWQQRDWTGVEKATAAALPAGRALTDADQTVILRRAVALALIGHEAGLKALRARYAAAFARLPTGPSFDLLTRDAASVNPADIATAMAKIPSASPAGKLGDLLYAAPGGG